MRDFLSITAALADEGRLRILLALRGRELCVCQLTELLGLAASTVSRHLSILKQARLIETRKDGRWIHCRSAGHDAPPAARSAIRWVRDALTGDERTTDDERRLAEILLENPEELCRRQVGRSCCAPADGDRPRAGSPRQRVAGSRSGRPE